MTAADRWNTAASDCFGDVDAGTAVPDRNFQTRIAVEALLKRLIVAGELKLMLPFELQGSGIQCKRGIRCGQHERSDEYQPLQQGK